MNVVLFRLNAPQEKCARGNFDQAWIAGNGYSVFVPDTQADPANKALWFIESRFAEEITLEDVARIAGVSRYHLSRL